MRQFPNDPCRDTADQNIFRNVTDDARAGGNNAAVPDGNLPAACAAGAEPHTAADRDLITLPQPGAPVMTADPVAAREEGNIRRNIAVIADHDHAIAMNRQVPADPAIRADNEPPGIKNRADDLRVAADRITDTLQEPPFDAKIFCTGKNMVHEIHRASALDGRKIHVTNQSSCRISALLHGPRSNRSGNASPFMIACDSCRSRFAATSAFHRSAIVW